MFIFDSCEPQILSHIYESFPFTKGERNLLPIQCPLCTVWTPLTRKNLICTSLNLWPLPLVVLAYIDPWRSTLRLHVCFLLFISFLWLNVFQRLFVFSDTFKTQFVVQHLSGCTRIIMSYTIKHRTENIHYTDNGSLWAKTSDSRIYFHCIANHTMHPLLLIQWNFFTL